MADVRIGAEWFDALEQYIEGLGATTELAASRATTYLEEQTEARAREDVDWSALADQIEVWSLDGALVVGIRDEAYVTRAFNMEYGDDQDPPNPLFRTMQGTAEGMSKVMGDTFYEQYGNRF